MPVPATIVIVGVDPFGTTIAESSRPLSPGDVVGDRYRIEETLGQGVMGTVYRVEHVLMRKRFALKVLDRAWVGSAEMVARFEREAIAAGNITDPHVAQATDFGRLADGSCFLVLEYVNGRTLRSALERGPFKPRRAIAIARSIAKALQAAHSRAIIHRDLKPENIMLVDREGDPDFVKVLDFGLARFESTVGTREAPGALTRQGAVVGTILYMSPEQVMGKRVDARTDLYALGVVLFEMLTGHCPFQGEPIAVAQQHVAREAPPLPPAILASAGDSIAEILSRLLAKTPEERFATAADLGAALDGCLAGMVAGKSAPSLVARDQETPSPGRTKTVALAASTSPVKPWSSLLTWSSEFVVRLRPRRSRRSLRQALDWPRTALARLGAWPKRRRSTLALLQPYAKRFRGQLGMLRPSPALRRWWWVFAIGVGAVVTFAIMFSLSTRERSTHVEPGAPSASARGVSTRPNPSASATLHGAPKPSASHR
jgi:serine/threonine protein kinase